MKKILFDTSALLCWILKQKNFELVRQRLKRVENHSAEGFISGITITELICTLGKEEIKKAFQTIAFLEESDIKALAATKETFFTAGNIRLQYKQKNLSTADCVILATAIQENVDEVVSSDQQWNGIQEINLVLVS